MARSMETQWCIFILYCSFYALLFFRFPSFSFSFFLFLSFYLSVLYYSNFAHVWETRIFDEAGSHRCLKSARLGGSSFPSVSKSTYLQLKFLRLYKSTANKFELYRSRCKESSHFVIISIIFFKHYFILKNNILFLNKRIYIYMSHGKYILDHLLNFPRKKLDKNKNKNY